MVTKFEFTPEPIGTITVNEEGQVIAPEPEREYSFHEKQLRDRFVQEYMIDYDKVKAAQRIGYGKSYALQYGTMLFNEPYVQREIKRLEGSTSAVGGTPEDEEAFKKRIIAGLVREANYHGSGSSQAARVAALGKLAQLSGMEPAHKSSVDLTTQGNAMQGAFVVPGIMTPEQWAEAAAAQQDALTAPEQPAAPADGVVIH